mgnify:CR=1 FL=1
MNIASRLKPFERNVNAYELSVADILVENGVISIQQSKITDTRLNNEVCGVVTQTVETIDTTELYRKLQGYIDERGQDVKGWIEIVFCCNSTTYVPLF